MDILFDTIYKKKLWSEYGDGSGIGSSPLYNYNMRSIMTDFVTENNVKTIIDVPCGAFQWQSVWLHELQEYHSHIFDSYVGIDISREAIKQAHSNIPRGISHNIEIFLADMINHPLPQNYDVLFCRDALQHLSWKNILKALKNFEKCNASWYIIGGYCPGFNENIYDGDYFDFNITQYPFWLTPDRILCEKNTWDHPQKPLFVFSGENFRVQLQQIL